MLSTYMYLASVISVIPFTQFSK